MSLFPTFSRERKHCSLSGTFCLLNSVKNLQYQTTPETG